MDHCKYVDVYKRIRSGETIRETAAACGISATEAYFVVAPIDVLPRRRRRTVRQNDVAAVLKMIGDGETSIHKISQAVGRPWHTVRRIVESYHNARKIRTYRCDGCGHIINVSPCVICAARRRNAATS
jgi:rubrerythrin